MKNWDRLKNNGLTIGGCVKQCLTHPFIRIFESSVLAMDRCVQSVKLDCRRAKNDFARDWVEDRTQEKWPIWGKINQPGVCLGVAPCRWMR